MSDEKHTSTKSILNPRISVVIPKYQRIGIKIKPRDIKRNTGAVVSRFSEKTGAVEKAGTIRPGMLLVAISEVNVQGMDTSSIVSFLRHRHKLSDLVVTFIETERTEENNAKKKIEKESSSEWKEKDMAASSLNKSPSSTKIKRLRRSSIDIDEEVPYRSSSSPSQSSSNIMKIKQEGVSYESLIEKSKLLDKESDGDMNNSVCSHHPCQNVSSCLLQ